MSKMVNCKDCGEKISTKAKSCPKCGAKRGLPLWLKAIIILIIIIVGVCACTSSCANSVDESLKEAENAYKDVKGKINFDVGETFENKYLKVTVNSVDTDWKEYDEYFEPTEGTKIVRVEVTAENIGDEETDISSLYFSCYADDVKMNEYFWGESSDKTSLSSVSPGKTTYGYLYYEVPINSEKYVLEYSPAVLEDDIIIKFALN